MSDVNNQPSASIPAPATTGVAQFVARAAQAERFAGRIVARTRPLVDSDFGARLFDRFTATDTPGRMAQRLADRFAPGERAVPELSFALPPIRRHAAATGRAHWSPPAWGSTPPVARALAADHAPAAELTVDHAPAAELTADHAPNAWSARASAKPAQADPSGAGAALISDLSVAGWGQSIGAPAPAPSAPPVAQRTPAAPPATAPAAPLAVQRRQPTNDTANLPAAPVAVQRRQPTNDTTSLPVAQPMNEASPATVPGASPAIADMVDARVPVETPAPVARRPETAVLLDSAPQAGAEPSPTQAADSPVQRTPEFPLMPFLTVARRPLPLVRPLPIGPLQRMGLAAEDRGETSARSAPPAGSPLHLPVNRMPNVSQPAAQIRRAETAPPQVHRTSAVQGSAPDLVVARTTVSAGSMQSPSDALHADIGSMPASATPQPSDVGSMPASATPEPSMEAHMPANATPEPSMEAHMPAEALSRPFQDTPQMNELASRAEAAPPPHFAPRSTNTPQSAVQRMTPFFLSNQITERYSAHSAQPGGMPLALIRTRSETTPIAGLAQRATIAGTTPLDTSAGGTRVPDATAPIRRIAHAPANSSIGSIVIAGAQPRQPAGDAGSAETGDGAPISRSAIIPALSPARTGGEAHAATAFGGLEAAAPHAEAQETGVAGAGSDWLPLLHPVMARSALADAVGAAPLLRRIVSAPIGTPMPPVAAGEAAPDRSQENALDSRLPERAGSAWQAAPQLDIAQRWPAMAGGIAAPELRQPRVDGAAPERGWGGAGMPIQRSGMAMPPMFAPPQLPLAEPALALQRAPESPPPAPAAAADGASAPGAPASTPSVEVIAQKVYDHLRRQLLIDHERLGRL